MSFGEINKGVIALLLALLLGAGGYLWYSQLYKPAVAARVSALAASSTAQQGLDAAKRDLAAAQEQVEASKSASAKVDDSVARLAKARAAVPAERRIDDAAIVLMQMARRAGVSTTFSSGGDDSAAAASSPGTQGAVPIDLEFRAAGSYAEMMQFVSLVESTVDVSGSKLYTRGRLFNVVRLEIGAPDDESATAGSSSGGLGSFGAAGEQPASNGPTLRPGDVQFTIVVRMYTSSTANAASVGAATPDPAAAATTPDAAASGATGAAGVPGATGTVPDATGAATGGAATDAAGAAAGGTVPAGSSGVPSSSAAPAPITSGGSS